MTRYSWPKARPGQSVGLLGGSFDPAHSGHMAVTLAALARFGLDHVWWLVTPGNPLKSQDAAAIFRRTERARRVAAHPFVTVTGIEADLGTRYTADTLAALQRNYPRQRFVWLMGSDNLAEFHRWDRWQDIIATVPIGVLARPGSRTRGLLSPAGRLLRRHRCAPGELSLRNAPAFAFASLPLNDESSTRIRAAGQWKR
ncbi:nicotinate-nucleotide adenylyltransferase [Palleronia caenipelagi]|uniref:Probable nicotinate-nucleotide adenylyltransferase n=1 Tax=Palleronia caenipelagi TaxID=2489174 RepID=A0A547Q5S6_9RHOB|nr:nicotinate-nucleotide adenylyltransferase [Palleronia caenipelagi]TRD21734.1 nicotinate-nucleotide adenylyltransferase [Palleronia caenipelagi]